MLVDDVKVELRRLQLHPVNLDASAAANDQVRLQGSLLAHWTVPQIIDGNWLLAQLHGLPDVAGPQATMDALCAAYIQKSAAP